MNNDISIILQKRLENAFNLTYDLYDSSDKNNLLLKIGNFPSNSIGNQAWCIIGARESYFDAIKNSKWIGFKCSLIDYNNKSDIIRKLQDTKIRFQEYLKDAILSTEQIKFTFDLLEHEIQHHGQLIRYYYSNKIKFPLSWKDRYTV